MRRTQRQKPAFHRWTLRAHRWSQRHVKSSKNHPNPGIGFMERSPSWSQLLWSRGKQTHPSRRRNCGTTLTNAALNSPSGSQRFELHKMSKRSRQRGSGLLTERGVWVPRPAVPDSSSSLNPGRISVLSCCPNSQWLHFIWTLGWSHGNQEDPVSLCWAGKRRRARGRRI